MAHISWKQEFDHKYRTLLNSYNTRTINAANDVLLKAIEGLDKIIKEKKSGKQ